MTNLRTRTRIAAAVLLTAAVAVLAGAFGGGDGGGAPRAEPPATSDAVLDRLLSGLGGNDTAGYVRRLERRLQRGHPDGDALLLLGMAYQQRARETGDPSFFSLSERALRRARRYRGTEELGRTGLASLAVSRHRFAAALRLARAALERNPENATAHGALGDALLNLGRYRRAFAAFDRMAELSPSVASYSRVAHARELLGRPAAARAALRLALSLDAAVLEHRAAALVQLGHVNFGTGALERAARAYAKALAARPEHVHAQAGLARVAAARGDHRRAAALLGRVVARLPLPQYAIWHGDVLRAAGRTREARRAYALVRASQRLQRAGGVRTDLQAALFDLDHGRRVRSALAVARAEYARAPSIDAADTLAWALERNGRCREAVTYSRRALRLGTHDALKLFHRGMIERCVGNRSRASEWFARALAANPHFSLLWSPVARRYAG
jgi:tetratricopeptide (TPR) repeat protein